MRLEEGYNLCNFNIIGKIFTRLNLISDTAAKTPLTGVKNTNWFVITQSYEIRNTKLEGNYKPRASGSPYG